MTSPDPSQPLVSSPATLGYATPDADGLPECLPEVDAAIDAGARPRALVAFFAKNGQAKRYIEKTFRRRFGIEQTTCRCAICSAETDLVVRIAWSFQMPAKFLSFYAKQSDMRGGVLTYHSICQPCLSKWIARTRFARRCLWLTQWTARLGFFVMLLHFVLRGLIGQQWLIYVPVAILAVSAIGGVFITMFLRRRMPREIRMRLPKWFTSNDIAEFDWRSQLLPPIQATVVAAEPIPTASAKQI